MKRRTVKRRTVKRRVVITGVGVVSPIGSTKRAFFDGLRQARPGVAPIVSFDASAFSTRIAGEVTDLPDLDPNLGRWSAGVERALEVDRKSRFAIAAGREVLGQAFSRRPMEAHYAPERRGLLLGAGLEIFDLTDLVPHVRGDALDGPALREDLAAAPPQGKLQIPADLGARCLAEEAQIEGHYQVNVSACAAGTQSLGEAYFAIEDGAIDLALCGGYDSMVNPLGLGGFTLLRALSTKNELTGAASMPFDRRRDGFVLGEGAAVFVVEEARSARDRGAEILGEILGYGTSLDAFRVTDPPPDHAGAVVSMRRALAHARLEAKAIDYVNAHGTGTKKNDPAEAKAITTVFGDHRVPVSSSKSQFGHLIGAAGAVEALAGLFAISENILPATINLEQPDPDCDLNHVAQKPRPAEVRRVMSNSFGFGGQNATIILGEVEDG